MIKIQQHDTVSNDITYIKASQKIHILLSTAVPWDHTYVL